MEQEESNHEVNTNLIQAIDKYSDEQWKALNFEIPNDSKQTVFKEELNNVNNKNIISTKNTSTSRIITTKPNINRNTVLPKKTTILFKTVEPQFPKYKRNDNLRKISFFVILIYFKTFFRERFGLNFESFNCDEVLGISICHMKKVLNLQIYQLFCYYKEYYKKILYFINHEKMNERVRNVFYYFMTRTYKELYKRFVSENISFPLDKKENEIVYVRINKFITLTKAIKKRTEKLGKKGKDDESIKIIISSFENLCKNMISDIENEKNVKGSENEKEFKPVVIEKFANMRNQFPSDDELFVDIELEEDV